MQRATGETKKQSAQREIAERKRISLAKREKEDREKTERKVHRAWCQEIKKMCFRLTYWEEREIDGVKEILPVSNKQQMHRNIWGRYPTEAKLQEHRKRQTTLFYLANEIAPTLRLMIEVDGREQASHIGTDNGPMAFLEYLAEKPRLSGLKFEPSTDGSGGHGWFDLTNPEMRTARHAVRRARITSFADTLVQWLTYVAASQDFDVGKISVKGIPPSYKSNSQLHKVYGTRFRYAPASAREFKMGDPAKIPRTLSLNQLQTLPLLTVEDDFSLPTDLRYQRDVTAGISHLCKTNVQNDSGSYGSHAHQSKAAVSPRIIQSIPRLVEWARGQKLDDLPVDSNYRGRVSAEDFAIFLIVAATAQESLASNDTFSSARIKTLWKVLTAEGQVSRPFNASRYAKIHSELRSRGLLPCTSPVYLFTQGSPDGHAMDWRLGPELRNLWENVKRGVLSFLLSYTNDGAVEVLTGPAEAWTPQRKFTKAKKMHSAGNSSASNS